MNASQGFPSPSLVAPDFFCHPRRNSILLQVSSFTFFSPSFILHRSILQSSSSHSASPASSIHPTHTFLACSSSSAYPPLHPCYSPLIRRKTILSILPSLLCAPTHLNTRRLASFYFSPRLPHNFFILSSCRNPIRLTHPHHYHHTPLKSTALSPQLEPTGYTTRATTLTLITAR